MEKYTVGIIGAGSIGALKPNRYDNPHNNNDILTHAHAVIAYPNTKLMCVIDPDQDKLKRVKDKWDTQTFTSLNDMNNFYKECPDILIVATPTNTHRQILIDCLNLNTLPKLVIAEKPFTENLGDALEIKNLYEEKNIPLLINYTRRFNPIINNLRNEIKENILRVSGNSGDFTVNENHQYNVQNCVIKYTRGLKREACHAIDLMFFFFGKHIVNECKLLNVNQSLNDYSDDDKTYAAYLSFEKCPHVFLTPCDGNLFSIFEIDILFNDKRIILKDHSLILSTSFTEDSTYGDYQTLSSEEMNGFTKLRKTLYYVIDNAVNYLNDKEELRCTVDDAINVHKLYAYLGV